MEINRNIRSRKLDVDEYITQLEEYILSNNGSNIMDLLVTADRMAGSVVLDMTKIVNDAISTEELVKAQEKLDFLVKVVSNTEKLKGLRAALTGHTLVEQEPIEGEENPKDAKVIDIQGNIYEHVLNKVTKKNGKAG